MESRIFFWFAGFCLVLCWVPSRPQYLYEDKISKILKIADLNSDQYWSDKDARSSRLDQIVWKREASSTRREIDGNKTDCSRYCIQKTRDAGFDSFKRINIIWNIIDDPRVSFMGETSNSRGISGYSTQERDFPWEPTRIVDTADIYSNDDRKCELYIELGCETDSKSKGAASLLNEFLNRDEKTIVTMDLTEGYTKREFTVDDFTEELRVLALGKLSQAVLEIPIANRTGDSTDARKPRPTLSLSRTSDERGVRLDARNPPPGGWRLKLLGVENSNYNFSVFAASSKLIAKNSSADDFANAKSENDVLSDVAISNEKISTPQRLVNPKISHVNARTQSAETDDQQMLVDELLPGEQSAAESEVLEFSWSKGAESAELIEKQISSKLPRAANPEVEMMESQVDDNKISGTFSDESPIETAKIVEDTELEEFARSTGEIQTATRKTVVDLSPNTELIARPGFHDVVFTVTNNQALGIRHAFRGRSTQFPLVGILPNNVLWIRSGETIEIAIRIQVPNVQDASPGIVTLYVGGNENFEVVEKSTYIYVQGSSQVPTTDNDKPSIDYSFNDNCNGKLNRDRCNKSLWSVEVTVKDPESGLKTVTSVPKGVEPRTEFIAGTKNSVVFYYISTCCYTTVDIKATDVQGNVQTRTIDVTDWDNLSQGEIAAIVVGALLILLLIILLVLLILYCVRRRKSHDLPYSQRYGSRTPTSTERTNF